MPEHTIAENLQRLQTAREDIITAISDKGGTVSENAGFEDFPTAIRTISGGGGNTIPLLTSLEWNALSTAEKQAYGLVAIQDTDSGYERGILVNGEDYEEKTWNFTILDKGSTSSSATYTFAAADKYKVIVLYINSEASTYGLNASVSLNGSPVTGTVLRTNPYDYSNTDKRNYSITEFTITANVGDTVTISGSNGGGHSVIAYAIMKTDISDVVKTLTTADNSTQGSYNNQAIVMYGTANNNVDASINIESYTANTNIDTGSPGSGYKSSYIFWFTI